MRKLTLTIAACVLGASPMLQAADEHCDRIARHQAPTQNPKVISAVARANASSQTGGENMLMSDATMPHTGERKVPVIIIQFEDSKITTENVKALYTKMLNEEGYTNGVLPGSVRDYYIDNSHGKFHPRFDVYGPVTVNVEGNLESYYINRPGAAVVDACWDLYENEGVDFAQYDTDGDYLIDNVITIFAGLGHGDRDAPEISIHPHRGFEYYGGDDPSIDNGWQVGGVYVNSYTLTPEYVTDSEGYGKHNDISSMIHEFSHAMGLPDFYHISEINPTNYYWTPSEWDVMDIGCYLDVPPSYSSIERYMFGWLEPEAAVAPSSVTLEPMTSSNKALIISSEVNKEDHTEFYLLETRDRNTGKWDSMIPGSGLLIWHIDYNKYKWDNDMPNQDHTCPGVDLMRADGVYDYYGDKMASNAYPGVNGTYTSFTPYSTYGDEYNTTFSKYPITNIRRVDSPGGTIAFDIAGGSAGGIDGIEADVETSYRYYDLRGIEVDPANAAPGIYLRRDTNGKVTKIIR